MIVNIFATKLGMTQAWTKTGHRLAITRCKMSPMPIITKQNLEVLDKNSQVRDTFKCSILEIGYGKKKLKNMSKPLRTKMEKSGFSFGVKNIAGIRVVNDKFQPTVDDEVKAGDLVKPTQVLSVGDLVKVTGISKGRGFAGAMKRHGFSGGPKTHGQSDRARAVGSIGAGTTPGRVWKGKKMPGHYGVETKTVSGLVVVYIDEATNEVWLSGPVPGHIKANLKISKTGEKKKLELDKKASGIKEEIKVEVNSEVVEKTTQDKQEKVAESKVEEKKDSK